MRGVLLLGREKREGEGGNLLGEAIFSRRGSGGCKRIKPLVIG